MSLTKELGEDIPRDQEGCIPRSEQQGDFSCLSFMAICGSLIFEQISSGDPWRYDDLAGGSQQQQTIDILLWENLHGELTVRVI